LGGENGTYQTVATSELPNGRYLCDFANPDTPMSTDEKNTIPTSDDYYRYDYYYPSRHYGYNLTGWQDWKGFADYPDDVDPVWTDRGACKRTESDELTWISESDHTHDEYERCGQIYNCPSGKFKYRFERLQIQNHYTCAFDWLRITTDKGYSKYTCNYISDEDCISDWIEVEGNKLLVEFHTDSTYSYYGYKMEIKCIEKASDEKEKFFYGIWKFIMQNDHFWSK